jgi:nitroreductase
LDLENGMIDNPTLTTIGQRRSAHRFTSEPISDEQLDAILEAGRWAPSARNSQPWDFVVVTDPQTRSTMAAILRDVTWAWSGFAAAPAMIVVAVSPQRDPDHYVEDGAIAAQNLCLAAHSVGLDSSWAGIYGNGARKQAAERALKKLLSLPRAHRVIAVIPIGRASHVGRGSRRPLAEMVHQERFHSSERSENEVPVASTR